LAISILGGYPDATTTGVPAGVTLTPHPGDLVINTPGAVISGLNITGTVYINAPNVTIENCSITSTGYACVNVNAGVAGTVVQNCVINGTGAGPQGQSGIGGQGTFINNNIYNVENGINVEGGNTVIKGNYIHDLGDSSGAAGHYDGIQVDGGFNNVTIDHNTVLGRDTSCIFICNDFGPMNNIVVNNNFLLGQDDAAYTIYVIEKPGNPAQITNVQVTNNVLGTGFWGWADVESTSPVWTNNTDVATGKIVSTVNGLSPAPAGSGSPTSSPDAPTIASFSNDTGIAGDHVTSDSTPTLTGKAVANSTVTVFDGAQKLGTVTANSSGAWSYTSAKLADGSHSFTVTATVSGTTGAASAALAVKIDTTAPAAPVETGDSVINQNQVSLHGTAEAGSTVKVYDGTSQVGTATVGATGSWTVTTSALSVGSHNLTATATDAAGNVSAVSAPLDPVISAPTTPPPSQTAPNAPVITSGDHVTNDNTVTVTGTAVAGSTVTVLDGATKLGTTTVGSNGAWSYTTAALTDGKHSLTATDTVSGKTSVASSAATLTIDTHAPTTPVLVSDSVVNTNHVLVSGTAEANSSITVYDGTAAVGTAMAGSNGAWSFTTGTLTTGSHVLTATASDAAGNTSAHSAGLDPVIGSPTAPSGLTGIVHVGNNYFLGSTGPELKYGGAVVATGQFDDWIPISSVKVDGGGYDVAWKNSSGEFTFWTTDSHGNFTSYPTHGVALAANGATVQSYENIFHQDLNGDHTIGVPGSPSGPGSAASISITSLTDSSQGLVTLKGTADALSQVKLFDGTTAVGTVKAAADGTWSYTSSSAVSDTTHTYKAQELDSSGHVVATSGNAILGSSGANTLTSTGGNNLFVGNGHPDTFVFAANFGKDVITDFNAGSGRGHDVIQFSKSVFDNFADVLSHATQSGQNVVIADDVGNSLTLNNVKLAALDKHDFHFA
jgi:Bacterial Ig-like domain/Tryptophan-rich Synechocystis species C-terminal domain/Right handed beta helix region